MAKLKMAAVAAVGLSLATTFTASAESSDDLLEALGAQAPESVMLYDTVKGACEALGPKVDQLIETQTVKTEFIQEGTDCLVTVDEGEFSYFKYANQFRDDGVTKPFSQVVNETVAEIRIAHGIMELCDAINFHVAPVLSELGVDQALSGDYSEKLNSCSVSLDKSFVTVIGMANFEDSGKLSEIGREKIAKDILNNMSLENREIAADALPGFLYP